MAPFVEQTSLAHYKKISKIPNVILVGPNINNIFLLKNSKAVITVTGSSSLEALFFNKPGFLFSKTEFSYLKNVYFFNEDNFYLNIIRNFKKNSKDFKNFLLNVLKFGFNDVVNNIIYANPNLSISDKYKENVSKKIFNIINYYFKK
jgi:capsule polysaccharide export protein KpsC/LpsZ